MQKYPKHWGNPPVVQTRDVKQLPYGYGLGSSTEAGWIRENFIKDNFVEMIRDVAWKAMKTAKSKGFSQVTNAEAILLMHAELSEAAEALRKDNPESEKIPGFTHVEEELADTVIRILNYCALRNYNIGDAILHKMKYNEGREYKHGGKKF